MAFICPVHGYYVPTPGITSALCPSCSRPSMVEEVPNGAHAISSVPPEIYAEVDRLREELRIARAEVVAEVVALVREKAVENAHLTMYTGEEILHAMADIIVSRFGQEES